MKTFVRRLLNAILIFSVSFPLAIILAFFMIQNVVSPTPLAAQISIQVVGIIVFVLVGVCLMLLPRRPQRFGTKAKYIAFAYMKRVTIMTLLLSSAELGARLYWPYWINGKLIEAERLRDVAYGVLKDNHEFFAELSAQKATWLT